MYFAHDRCGRKSRRDYHPRMEFLNFLLILATVYLVLAPAPPGGARLRVARHERAADGVRVPRRHAHVHPAAVQLLRLRWTTLPRPPRDRCPRTPWRRRCSHLWPARSARRCSCSASSRATRRASSAGRSAPAMVLIAVTGPLHPAATARARATSASPCSSPTWGVYMGIRHSALHLARDIGQGFSLRNSRRTYLHLVVLHLLDDARARRRARHGPPRTARPGACSVCSGPRAHGRMAAARRRRRQRRAGVCEHRPAAVRGPIRSRAVLLEPGPLGLVDGRMEPGADWLAGAILDSAARHCRCEHGSRCGPARWPSRRDDAAWAAARRCRARAL